MNGTLSIVRLLYQMLLQIHHLNPRPMLKTFYFDLRWVGSGWDPRVCVDWKDPQFPPSLNKDLWKQAPGRSRDPGDQTEKLYGTVVSIFCTKKKWPKSETASCWHAFTCRVSVCEDSADRVLWHNWDGADFGGAGAICASCLRSGWLSAETWIIKSSSRRVIESLSQWMQEQKWINRNKWTETNEQKWMNRNEWTETEMNEKKWMNKMNEQKWMNRNESTEMNQQKWINRNEWTELNEKKWINRNKSTETNEQKWIKRNESTEMNQQKWINRNEWTEMNQQKWINRNEWTERNE